MSDSEDAAVVAAAIIIAVTGSQPPKEVLGEAQSCQR